MYELSHTQAIIAVLNVEVHRILNTDDIHEVKRFAVGIGVKRIVERHLALQFFPAAEVH